MNTPARAKGTHTIEEWLAQPESARFELIDGNLVQKAAPTLEHGMAQGNTRELLGGFSRRHGGGTPGGWWIATEVEIELDGRGFRPDLVGWRRERVAQRPTERPVGLRPDWICEIVSESNRTTDTVTKLRRYHQSQVPWYWLLDPADRTLTVYKHQPDGYLVLLSAEAHEVVRAEPFDAIELKVAVLLGDDPDDVP